MSKGWKKCDTFSRKALKIGSSKIVLKVGNGKGEIYRSRVVIRQQLYCLFFKRSIAKIQTKVSLPSLILQCESEIGTLLIM